MQVGNKEAISSSQLSDVVVNGMLGKKAKDVVVLDLREVKNAVADYFVICSGTSDTQIDAIADGVEKEAFEKGGQKPWKQEGRQNREWLIIDFIDVVAHVFNQDKRTFYGLEDLWGDAKITHVQSDN